MNNKGIASIFVVLFLVISLFVGYGAASVIMNKGISESDVQTQITNAITNITLEKDSEIQSLNNQIALLEQELNSTTNNTNGSVVVEDDNGYLIDGLYLNSLLNKELSDREVNLFDGKVYFKDKSYDAEEVVSLSNLKVAINEEDFKENAYLQLPKNSVAYKLEFESDLNTSEISEDDTLQFNFLGKDVEVSEWDSNSVTFFKGKIMSIDEDEIVTLGEYTILPVSISDDKVYISVTKNNITKSKIISESKTSKVNGLEIKVLNVFSSSKNSFVEIVAGEDIKVDVSDGEEYEDNSIFEYSITNNSIGIVLKEDFKELNDREDYNVLDKDDTFCLPNDYLCLKYNGLSVESSNEYTFELDGNMVVVDGKFISGLEDYDEIFINKSSGLIYDDDDMTNEITNVSLEGSELEFSVNTTNIYIDDLNITIDLDSILVNGYNISSKEDSYRNEYGIVISSPKDNLEDNEVSILVPENKLEASVSII